MLTVAHRVNEDGFCVLSESFRLAFPNQVYKTDIALKRLLQMPLAAIRVGEPSCGRATWFLVEYIDGVNYVSFAQFSEALYDRRAAAQSLHMTKNEIKQLLGLAASDRERELVRYSVFKSSGLSSTAARKHFGFQNMQERSLRVKRCIEEVQQIREAIEKLSIVEDKAILNEMGIDAESSDSECSSDDESEILDDTFHSECTESVSPSLYEPSLNDPMCSNPSQSLPDFTTLEQVLKEGQYNWFYLIDYVEGTVQVVDHSLLDSHLFEFYSYVVATPIDLVCKELLAQSRAAFQVSQPDVEEARTAAALNGDVVTDSESDDPNDYVGLTSVASEGAKSIIARKRKALRRRIRRQKVKVIASKRFLCRKVSKHVKSVVDRFPDIGQTIEQFVSESNIGADAWRRTGVLTFDGNLRVKQKVTYNRIKEHLQEKYKCKFSYGTTVQLCVARNKRRRSASNYRGVAKVTCRRARKGFELRYNPDKHWSCALYKGLNYIEYTDGTEICNVNRDDASGYRLDTLTTHGKHATPSVVGDHVLTTHTDYVNRYPSVLQTTSYNFTATSTTYELCAGVVKAAKVYPKNAAQHHADLDMLMKMPELQSAFVNPCTGEPKKIDCVRVDGASDEGPSHDEVRFWWAARHLEQGRLVTLLTSRSSGASYLNKVELQNGCLALAHTNLFIPSTLNGSPFSQESGELDMEKLKSNLDLATTVYIERANNAPCGETTIKLYRGASSEHLQAKRDPLMVFLKGSKKRKEQLERENPELYKYFKNVWDVKKAHEIRGLPPQYVYLLVCCFQTGCPHPLCQRGKEGIQMEWFQGGPSVNNIPLPVPDPDRPWGGNNCQKCSGFCTGHFLSPTEALASTSTPMNPPSVIIKDFFQTLKGHEPSSTQIEEVAKQTLLPIAEVCFWLDHLKTVQSNRQRGAIKAAETRRRKRQNKKATNSKVTYNCGVCDAVYGESEDAEFWIGCEKCDTWVHGECVNITPANEPDKYYCSVCASE